MRDTRPSLSLSAASKLGIWPVAPALAPDGVLEAPAAALPAASVDGLLVDGVLVDGVLVAGLLVDGLVVVALPLAPDAVPLEDSALGVAELAPLPEVLGEEVCAIDVPASASSAAAVALVISFNVMNMSP